MQVVFFRCRYLLVQMLPFVASISRRRSTYFVCIRIPGTYKPSLCRHCPARYSLKLHRSQKQKATAAAAVAPKFHPAPSSIPDARHTKIPRFTARYFINRWKGVRTPPTRRCFHAKSKPPILLRSHHENKYNKTDAQTPAATHAPK